MLLSRDAISRGDRGRASRRPTSTSRRTATSTTRSWRSTAWASRSTRSPSPRSCAAPTCSTLSAASAALLRLQAETPASANASHYAKIVNELALLRRLIGVAGDIAEMGYDDSGDVRRDARPRRVAGVRGRRAARRPTR